MTKNCHVGRAGASPTCAGWACCPLSLREEGQGEGHFRFVGNEAEGAHERASRQAERTGQGASQTGMRSFGVLSAPHRSTLDSRRPVLVVFIRGTNSILSKNISARTSVHLRAPARTDAQPFTALQKHVRGFSVRSRSVARMI